jgi:hypothetical protein
MNCNFSVFLVLGVLLRPRASHFVSPERLLSFLLFDISLFIPEAELLSSGDKKPPLSLGEDMKLPAIFLVKNATLNYQNPLIAKAEGVKTKYPSANI